MKFSKTQKKEAYQKLSSELQGFVTSNESMENISAIAQKHHLDSGQEDFFDSEIYHTMLGLQSLEEVAINLRGNLNLPETQMMSLITDLKIKIFNKLEEIEKGHGNSTQIHNEMMAPRAILDENELEAPKDVYIPTNLPTEEPDIHNEDVPIVPVPQPHENQVAEPAPQIPMRQITNLEEKIATLTGSPSEKLAWEQRKEKMADKIMTDSKYGSADPYREPLS